MRILIIEDDLALLDALHTQLTNAGYDVDMCTDGADASFYILKKNADLILLDRMLPGMDGLSILKLIRANLINTPVILATAMNQLEDRIEGLDSGADDYIVKPYDVSELLARIRALTRRPGQILDLNILHYQDLTMNPAEYTLSTSTRQLTLSKREASLFEYMLHNPDKTLSRELLLTHVWGADCEVEDGNLDNYIHFVRKRLRALQSCVILTTVHGVGYRLEAPDSAGKLQYDAHISQNWLTSMESDNHLLIHIEENGHALLYSGTTNTATNRSILIERARNQAMSESIDTDTAPVSTTFEKSSLLTIGGNAHDYYQGIVMVFSSKSSYFTLILLKDITQTRRMQWLQRLLFLCADILGIFCLFLVNWRFVGKALEPILINEQKQHAFIAAASHELRSPLAVIEASADAITSSPCDSPRFTGHIKDECHRMSRLIGDMLLLASAKSRQNPPVYSDVDLDTLLLNTFERYETLCTSKGLHLRLTLPDDSLPVLHTDAEQLMHILSIFLDNGITYAPAESTLELAAACERGSFICSVIDHGIGIPDAQKEQVFTYFYRADQSRKDKQHFGLGLSVASELAAQLSGHIDLIDTPGGGATFRLLLPLGEGKSYTL